MCEKFLDWLFFKNPEKVIVGIMLIAAGLLVWAVFAINAASDRRAQLMQQCMNDGKKEYECEAILKSNSTGTTTVVPMVMGRQ